MDSIDSAIATIRSGGIVAVVDDEDRENEGDLIMAASAATEEKVAIILEHSSGVLCVAITRPRADELELPPMVARNTESMRTAFTVSVDLRGATTTGISAGDRAATCRAIACAPIRPHDLLRPGHVFPLVARDGGVLKRAGHTEAAVDLCRLAGLAEAGLLSEIVSPDRRRMANRTEIEALCASRGFPLVTIAEIIRYRRNTERLVERVSSARVPTPWAEFQAYAYRGVLDGTEHVAFVRGARTEEMRASIPLVRVHSECLTGDVFRSLRCDCGEQLEESLRIIASEPFGVLVYLRGHEGRGVGLCNKVRAYALQDEGRDTVDANVELGLPIDGREYGVGAQILADLGVTRMRLLTNNPGKYGGLQGYGLEIVERVPLIVRARPENERYLETKRTRMGHILDEPRLRSA